MNDEKMTDAEAESKKTWEEMDMEGGENENLASDENLEQKGDEPAPSDQEAAEQTDDDGPETEPAPKPEAREDKGSELPDDPEELKRMIAERDHKLLREQGRSKAYQAQLRDKQSAESQPTNAPQLPGRSADEPKQDERFEEFKEDYPEIADYLANTVQPLKDALESLTSTQQQQAQTVMQENFARFKEALPSDDYLAQNIEEIEAWIETDAPVKHARAYERNKQDMVDPDSAIEMLQAFQEYQGHSADMNNTEPNNGEGNAANVGSRRQRQLESAASPRSRARPVNPSSNGGRDDYSEAAWKRIKV